jgi:23S rRNA pseudouridine1911/1915/1917 synthase
MKLFDVLYEDAHLLVVNKPAGLVCHPTKGDLYSSLISRVRLHLGTSVHPQLVNRLDRETSGVVLVAKDVETAGELRRIWESRDVQKRYLAIVHGHVTEERGSIDAPLGKDERSAVAIKDMVRPDGLPSTTEYEVLSRFERGQDKFSLLRVVPRTGRKHQIRIHLAHIGHSIVGDKLYGGDEELYLAFVQYRLTEEQIRRLILPNQALHASAVVFRWREQDWTFAAEPEPWFSEFHAKR